MNLHSTIKKLDELKTQHAARNQRRIDGILYILQNYPDSEAARRINELLALARQRRKKAKGEK